MNKNKNHLYQLIIFSCIFTSSTAFAVSVTPRYLDGKWELSHVTPVKGPAEEGVLEDGKEGELKEGKSKFESWIDPRTKILFQIEDDKGEMTLNRIPNHEGCEVKVSYETTYCCPKMKKLFLSRESIHEKPEGCLKGRQSDFAEALDQWVFPEYRFEVGAQKMSLSGPYKNTKRVLHFKKR